VTVRHNYVVYSKCWDKLQKWVRHAQKFISVWVRRHFSKFRLAACWPQSFRFLSVGGGALQTLVYSSPIKNEESLHQRVLLCLSNHWQPPRDLGKGATVRDHTCPCVHWYRWRIFWEFVVNCDLINSEDSTVIEVRTCSVNVWCQM